MDEHYTRMLGVRDGLTHALISVSNIRRCITGPCGCYLPPARNTRKLAAANTRIAELDKVKVLIEHQLSGVQAAIEEEKT